MARERRAARFWGFFQRKREHILSFLTNTLGPIELWALTTTSEDAFIRNALYKKMDATKARAVLARFYPSGSALKEIEETLSRMKEESGMIDDTVQQGVLDTIITKLEQAAMTMG